MSENPSERIIMSVSVEAARILREIAPPAEHQNIKGRIAKAARSLGWSFNRVKDIWYGDQRVRLRAAELSHLRSAIAQKSRAHVALRDAARLETAAAALAAIDPEFHRLEIERLRLLAGHLRGEAPLTGEG